MTLHDKQLLDLYTIIVIVAMSSVMFYYYFKQCGEIECTANGNRDVARSWALVTVAQKLFNCT